MEHEVFVFDATGGKNENETRVKIIFQIFSMVCFSLCGSFRLPYKLFSVSCHSGYLNCHKNVKNRNEKINLKSLYLKAVVMISVLMLDSRESNVTLLSTYRKIKRTRNERFLLID